MTMFFRQFTEKDLVDPNLEYRLKTNVPNR